MAFVNLPPNFQDMFYSITDRIAKLETGPNQAMYTAEYAQEVAESAQGGSLTAQTTAAAALAQSTIAQAEAVSAQAAAAGANTTASLALAQSTIAQAQAVSAQATAAAANTTASTSLAQSTIAQAQATSAQALASTANTNASTASAQATAASAQAVTAQATANTAYLQANVASAQAIIATNTANAAASQATIAQSQATIASSQATAAQVSADGKNKVYYSTSAPGATANQVGDIWYQYGTTGTYANKVIAQFSGAGGTSWTPVTVSGLVIANIDAGAITTGTLSAITITAGSGGNAFNVSSTGVMSAQGAWIKGNITADSGTFNGQVNATSGYFGSLTNGWAIQSTGITSYGTPGGYVSGGTIQGTNFNNGNGRFFVNSNGDLVAQSVFAQGVIRATSGYFGSGSSGWQIDSNGITGLGTGLTTGYIAGGLIQGTTFNNNNKTFYVGPTGDMVAQNVYVKGAVLGTSGYFGNDTNGWQIDTNGITGKGSGYIAGGAIQGTTFNNNNGTFFVSAQGAVVAQSVFAQGVIRATSGFFGSAGAGWQIDPAGITGIGTTGYIAGGTIQGATFNNNNKTFYVGPTGDMVAQNVYIKGQVLATSGYFGNVLNGWAIQSTGITGIGGGYIAGGQIQGTTFNNGSGTFQVTSGGVVTATSGEIAGWTLQPTYFSNIAADTFLYSNPGTDGLAYSTVGRGIMRRLQLNGASGTTLGTNVLAVGGNTSIDGTTISIGSITTNQNLTVDGSATFGNATANPFLYLSSSGTLRSLYTYGVARTAATRTMIIDSSGNFGTTASTLRKKHEIQSYKIDSSALLKLDVKEFKYKPEFDPEQQIQHGFIAEEAQELGLDELIQYDSTGVPDYFAYEKLPIFLLQLIQEQDARIKELENKLANS